MSEWDQSLETMSKKGGRLAVQCGVGCADKLRLAVDETDK